MGFRPISAIKDFGALNFPYGKAIGTNLPLFSRNGFTKPEGTVFTRTDDTKETNDG